MTPAEFQAPSVEYSLLSPLLIIAGVAIVGVLVEAYTPRRWRYLVQTLLSLGGIVGALVATVIVGMNLESRGGGAGRGSITGRVLTLTGASPLPEAVVTWHAGAGLKET